MKKAAYIALVSLFVLFINGCFLDDFHKIIVKNISDYNINNITIVYRHGENGEQTIIINELKYGETKTIEVNLKDSSFQTYTTDVEIEYYINGKKYDAHNEENVNWDVVGVPYTNAYIGAGNHVRFSIGNDSYNVKIFNNSGFF